MNSLRLILRNLFYFRAASIAVIAGVAVAGAVLAGALMVGDSVRGSLRELAVQRLGQTDEALAATQFFDASLAKRVADATALAGRFEVVPGVIVSGGASVGEGEHSKRTGDVQIAALGGSWVPVERGACVLNGDTADALGVSTAGAGPFVFTFPSMEDAPRDAAVARRDLTDAVAQLRVEHGGVVRENGMTAQFNLYGGQRVPRNAWLNIADLADAVNQHERANVLLTHDKTPPKQPGDGAAAALALNAALKQVVTLDDYGLSVKAARGVNEASLSSRATYLPTAVVAAATRIAGEMGITPRTVTVNLVNQVIKTTAGAGEAPSLHYVVGAGISSIDDQPVGPDDLVMNQDTATQLDAKVGDAFRLVYFSREAGGELKESNSADLGHTFHLTRIFPMPEKIGGSLAADPSLTPNYKGLTDAASVSEWDPPKELGITGAKLDFAKRDNDAYWKKYKASPRFFISIATATKLWGGPFGELTSIRIPAGRADEYARRLRDAIDPGSMGMTFRPLRAQQLAAASGGTDFSELFLYFSFFLIIAAALLVAMLFRLAIEQRARQFGLLSAVGFTPRKLRRVALAEGMTLAMVGSLFGLAGAIGYTWLLVYGLRTWWVGAVGTTALRLYVEPMTLLSGFAATLSVAFVAILWSVWRVGRVAPARLLSGSWAGESSGKARTGRVTRLVGIALAVLGLLLLIGVFVRIIPQPEAALGAGAVLLCGGLTWLGGVLRPHRHEASGAGLSSVEALGVRNASRHTGRSILSVGLIAFAAFTLIVVAAMRRQSADDTGDKTSGAGGYRLIVQAGIPLLGDLNTPQGRSLLGVRSSGNGENPLWHDAQFTSLRRWAGQDISCLNLTRPDSPTILGVPHSMVERGGFSFASTETKTDNPWTLIEAPPGSGGEVVPVIADDETAEFILKLSIGKTMRITDQAGQPRDLKLVATLSHSIFQSEMLMSEANFRRLFPRQAGFGTVLVEAPADKVQALRQLFNSELESSAVSIDTTAERLDAYKQIINTYLSTFQTLGALGLALGTIGLAVVLIRNVIERRPELALLSALGFRPNDRVRLVLSENAFLLVLGLIVGAICALLGVIPTVLTSRGGIAWLPLMMTLLAVLVLGFIASALAVWVSGVRTTPADLRSE